MAKLKLSGTYKQEDINHVIHGSAIPSEFEKGGSKLFAEGHGARLIGIDGKEYVDGMCAGYVALVGYGNQELVEAARLQLSKLHHFPDFGGRSNLPEIQLANKLSEITPPGLQHFIFTNSGSDANESAFKTARWYWGIAGQHKYKFIYLDKGYHGATYGALSACGTAIYTSKHFAPFVPGFVAIPCPYCYRCPFDKTYPNCDIDCAQALEEKIKQEGADTIAGFIGEPALSSGGSLVPPKEYWPKIREICTKYNILLIVDEVITGFGRMGKLWGHQNWGIQPDIMVFAKGLASAYMPIGGVAISNEIYKGMIKSDESFPQVFTYGGHAASCAVALKNVEIILRDKLVEKAAQMGVHIRERLDALKEKSPYIGDVRGFGLYFGIELVKDKITKESANVGMQVRNEVYERGAVMGGIGPNMLTIGPALIISEDEIDYIIDQLEIAIQNLKI